VYCRHRSGGGANNNNNNNKIRIIGHCDMSVKSVQGHHTAYAT